LSVIEYKKRKNQWDFTIIYKLTASTTVNEHKITYPSQFRNVKSKIVNGSPGITTTAAVKGILESQTETYFSAMYLRTNTEQSEWSRDSKIGICSMRVRAELVDLNKKLKIYQKDLVDENNQPIFKDKQFILDGDNYTISEIANLVNSRETNSYDVGASSAKQSSDGTSRIALEQAAGIYTDVLNNGGTTKEAIIASDILTETLKKNTELSNTSNTESVKKLKAMQQTLGKVLRASTTINDAKRQEKTVKIVDVILQLDFSAKNQSETDKLFTVVFVLLQKYGELR